MTPLGVPVEPEVKSTYTGSVSVAAALLYESSVSFIAKPLNLSEFILMSIEEKQSGRALPSYMTAFGIKVSKIRVIRLSGIS